MDNIQKFTLTTCRPTHRQKHEKHSFTVWLQRTFFLELWSTPINFLRTSHWTSSDTFTCQWITHSLVSAHAFGNHPLNSLTGCFGYTTVKHPETELERLFIVRCRFRAQTATQWKNCFIYYTIVLLAQIKWRSMKWALFPMLQVHIRHNETSLKQMQIH